MKWKCVWVFSKYEKMIKEKEKRYKNWEKNENSKKREDKIGFCTLTWIFKSLHDLGPIFENELLLLLLLFSLIIGLKPPLLDPWSIEPGPSPCYLAHTRVNWILALIWGLTLPTIPWHFDELLGFCLNPSMAPLLNKKQPIWPWIQTWEWIN